MSRFEGKIRVVLVSLAMAVTAAAQRASQEPVQRLGGALSFGWLDSYVRETFIEGRKNPFASLRLDYQSYLWDPDFLSFRIQPRLSTGFQDAFTGMSEGSGAAADIVFLRRRPWPFRVRYARFRRSIWTTGLNLSYARYTSRNDDSLLGLQWQLLLPSLPKLEINFDRSASATAPETVLAQGFDSRSRTFSLNARDNRWGWSFNGAASLQRMDTDYVLGRTDGPLLIGNRNRIRNVLAMAQRTIHDGLNLMLTANRTSNLTEFDRGLFDQSFQAAAARLDYRPPGRFQAWTQARQTESSLESTPFQLPGAEPASLPSAKVANQMLDGEARFEIATGTNLFGRTEYTRVQAPKVEGIQQSGSFVNVGGGILTARKWRSLNLAGSYYVFTTRTEFARDNSTNLWGQALDASVSAGDPARIRVSAGLMINRSRENVRAFLPYSSQAERVQGALARTFFHSWTLEVQGAVARNRYDRQALRSDFIGRDYGASLTGPRVYVGYSRAIGSGNSYQPALGFLPVLQGELFPPVLLVVGSSNSLTMANAAWNLNRWMSLRGIWRGQVQTVGNLLSSRFEQQEATLNWQFRKVRLEAGYQVYRFNFGLPIIRRAAIIRVTRDFLIF